MQRPLLLLLLFTGVSACTSVWTQRSIPACYVPSGTPELDRERSYYAALLATGERKYIIVHADAPHQIEVEYHSSYKPEQAYTRWLIDVNADATLAVQSLPADAPVSRGRLRRQEQWFQMLSASTRRFSCRDLNWLRWEAQNRGLVPIAEGLPAGSAEPNGAGSEPTQQPDGRPQNQLPYAVEQVRRARVQELERERAKIPLIGPIAMMATGVGLVGGAVALAELAVLDPGGDCDETYSLGGEDVPSCKSQKLRRNLGIGAGALALASAGLLATGGTLLMRRLRKRREIGRELRVLAEPRLSFGVDRHGLNVSLRATF